MALPVDGVVLLDKPLGISSHSAVARLRRLSGAERAGHVGSLDPLATGMLPICLGEATKIAGLVAAHDKAYQFTIALGAQTSTGDREGEVIERAPIPELTIERVGEVLGAFVGTTEQLPPMYSAIKQSGQPLYRLARQGKSVERTPRKITIEKLEATACRPGEIDLEVRCGKGTYVRVLGEDIARMLGSLGHLSRLRRVWVAPFEGAAMWTLDTLAAAWADHRDLALLATSAAVPGLPRVDLTAQESVRMLHGQAVVRTGLGPGTCWLRTEDGAGIGLGQILPAAADGLATILPQRMFTRPIS
jgi:tRNA pseudouridine55 synthase